MTLDPEKEFTARDTFEKEQAEKHQGMQDLIRSSETRFLTLEHNDIQIRIRPALPGKARKSILKLATKYKGVNLEALKRGDADITSLPDGFLDDSTDQLYQSLAALCIDAPYNDPESWRYYDEQTGEAELVYQKADALIEEAHKTAISFRKESGGAGAH